MKNNSLAIRVLRFSIASALFVSISLFSNLTSYFIAQRVTVEISEDVVRAIHIIIALLSYHSFFKAFIITDKTMRGEYYNSKDKFLKYALQSHGVRVSFLVSALFFAFFPNAFGVKSFLGWTEIPIVYGYLILAVAYFIILALTWLECFSQYEISEAKSIKEKRQIKDTSILVKSVIFASIVYPITAYVLPIFFPTLRTLPKVAFLICIVFIPIIVGAILLFSVVDYIRAFFVRYHFFNKLKKAAKKNGYEITKINHPYTSLFASYDEKSFTIKANNKVYDCKLLCSLHYGDPMYFEEDGKGRVVRHITMRFRTPIAGPFARGGMIWQKMPDDFAQLHSEFKYSFEGEGKKILIICPTPHSIYSAGYGQNRLIDVNDRVYDYTIMTGTAFINALERDAIK